MTERKALVGWLDMVELERCQTAAIATDPAGSSCLIYERLLDPPAALGDRFRSAL
ncbi:MAG TPA: hypothetical protein VHY18_07970 [Solirubrobacteraceae bacterium]|nr:hypothetical protein [Solirubrobacteraceae bacterium]